MLNLLKDIFVKMTKKLKCWKKSGKDVWRNTKNNKRIVEINPYNKSYIVQTEKGFNAEGLISIESSKVKAMKQAIVYMRKHNKC